MKRCNVVGLQTRHGFRTCELYQGDLAALDRRVDVLIVSSFVNNYDKTPGSVIGSLWEQYKIDVKKLAQEPEIDFRESLGLWCSRPLHGNLFTRIVCVEIVGSNKDITEILENVFVGLTILEAKQYPITRVALPVLGAGYQRVSAVLAAQALIIAARRYLDRSVTAESVMFVEIDGKRANEISHAMDTVLGRESALLAPTQLVNSVRADLSDAFKRANSLFESDTSCLREDWQLLLDSPFVRIAELGLLGRRLVELLITRLDGGKAGNLFSRIRSLEEKKRVAPWICAYMHVLRHLGNEAVHVQATKTRVPLVVDQSDLGLCLLCVERLLQFWEQNMNVLPLPVLE